MITKRDALAGAFLGCILSLGSAFAETTAGSAPPEVVPPGAKAEVDPFTFLVDPLRFDVEAFVPPPGMMPAAVAPAPVSKPAAPLAAMPAAPAPAVKTSAPPVAAGSLPPDAVPADAKAEVVGYMFSTVPLSFGIEPTVADVAAKPEGKAVRFTLAADVLFDFDKADLRPEADVALRKFLGQLQARMPRARLIIEGHTDGKGSDDYNDRLAIKRAQSVQMWLSTAGAIPAAAIGATGYGKRKPVAPNIKPDGTDDPDGRQKNRRVEILAMPS